jgi:hypothetical protein
VGAFAGVALSGLAPRPCHGRADVVGRLTGLGTRRVSLCTRPPRPPRTPRRDEIGK